MKAIAFWDEELPDVQAQNGYDLGELDGITVTSKNSVSYDFREFSQYLCNYNKP